MKREEEIQKLIDEEMGVDNYGSSDYQVGVHDGVKLADKTMIEKACEWLKENIDIYAKVVINHKSNYPEIVMCDTFEKNFIKAMEK